MVVLALMIRIVSPVSVCDTTRIRPGADKPMIRNRRSAREWSVSGNVVESESSKTVAASRKSTPCALRFSFALFGSQVNFTTSLYALFDPYGMAA